MNINKKAMFLDEQIVEKVLTANFKDLDIAEIIKIDVLIFCNKSLISSIESLKPDENIVPSFKRVCNSWDFAAKTLEKKGIFFIKKNGFKDYILENSKLSVILISEGLKI
jgi:hypothetical protein